MRKSLIPFLAAALAVVPAAIAAEKEGADGWKPLFNGRDLTGLKVQFNDKDKDNDPAKTFSVKEGALIISGKPTCYIYTDKSYSNYVLTYDWRFPEGSTPDSNSGCLVHIQLPHKVMPKCIEPQGRYRDHGKIFFMGFKAEATFDAAAQKKALKPMGQWSTTDVTANADGSVSVKLNGTPVSSCKTDLTSGPIGFQSEGYEVHFKNIKIKEMK